MEKRKDTKQERAETTNDAGAKDRETGKSSVPKRFLDTHTLSQYNPVPCTKSVCNIPAGYGHICCSLSTPTQSSVVSLLICITVACRGLSKNQIHLPLVLVAVQSQSKSLHPKKILKNKTDGTKGL